MRVARAAAESFANKVLESVPIKHPFMNEAELRQAIRDEVHQIFLPHDVSRMRKKYPMAFGHQDSMCVTMMYRSGHTKAGWSQGSIVISYISCDIEKNVAKSYVEEAFTKPQERGQAEFLERRSMRDRLIETVIGLGSWNKVREAMPELYDFIPEKPEKAQLPAAQINSVVSDLVTAGLKVEVAHA